MSNYINSGMIGGMIGLGQIMSRQVAGVSVRTVTTHYSWGGDVSPTSVTTTTTSLSVSYITGVSYQNVSVPTFRLGPQTSRGISINSRGQAASNLPDDVTLKREMLALASKCQAFLTEFIKALEQESGPAHRSAKGEIDMGAIFDRIAIKVVDTTKTGKVFRAWGATGNAKGVADVIKGKRAILYRNFSTSLAFAAVTLSELWHHAREDGIYSDRNLDSAMEQMIGEDAYKQERAKLKKDYGDAPDGMVAHKILNGKCQ